MNGAFVAGFGAELLKGAAVLTPEERREILQKQPRPRREPTEDYFDRLGDLKFYDTFITMY